MKQQMQEPTFAILSSLAEAPRHGYGIIADVLDLTDGAMRLQPGTLYSALERLRVAGTITISSEDVIDGRHRRIYALTADGVALLRQEAMRRQRAAERTLARITLSGALAGGVA